MKEFKLKEMQMESASALGAVRRAQRSGRYAAYIGLETSGSPRCLWKRAGPGGIEQLRRIIRGSQAAPLLEDPH